MLLSDAIVDDKALVTPVGTTFAVAMNGTAFQNDTLVSHNGWQYTAWYDTVGTDQNVWIGRPSILGPVAGAWGKFDTGSDQVNGDESEWDTHNTISLGISKADGILHLSWDHHGNTLRYRRSLPGLATYADAVWSASRILAEKPTPFLPVSEPLFSPSCAPTRKNNFPATHLSREPYPTIRHSCQVGERWPRMIRIRPGTLDFHKPHSS